MASVLLGGGDEPRKSRKPPKPVPAEQLVITDAPSPPPGRTLGLVGEHSSGKTTTALLLGYLNKRYIPDFEDRFPKTAELLELDLIPEVRRIIVIETQNKLKKFLTSPKCIERVLIDDLIKDGTEIVYHCVNLKRVMEKYKDGKWDVEGVQEMEECGEMFHSTVMRYVSDDSHHDLMILDNISDYSTILDDKMAVLHGSIIKANTVLSKGGENLPDHRKKLIEDVGMLKQMQQQHWKYRNKWWFGLLTDKKGFMGWNVDIIDRTRKNPNYVKDGEDPWNVRVPTGTFKHIDDHFYLTRDYDYSDHEDYIRVEQRGKYSSGEPRELTIPFKDRFAALSLIEAIAPSLNVDKSEIK